MKENSFTSSSSNETKQQKEQNKTNKEKITQQNKIKIKQQNSSKTSINDRSLTVNKQTNNKIDRVTLKDSTSSSSSSINSVQNKQNTPKNNREKRNKFKCLTEIKVCTFILPSFSYLFLTSFNVFCSNNRKLSKQSFWQVPQ